MSLSHAAKVKKLYKAILKIHRGFPRELQIVGTNYARDEFRRHKNCSPKEADIFMKEWTDYGLIMAKQLGLDGPYAATETFGNNLTPSDLDFLRDEQIMQLFELKEEATKPMERADNS